MREYDGKVNLGEFSGYGSNKMTQYFAWLGYPGSLGTCKAYLADNAVSNRDLLKGPYIMYRPCKEPYDPARTEQYLQCWEQALGVEKPTEVLTTEKNYVILVKPSEPWLYGPPGLHLHTLLARTALDWPGDTNPLEHIYVTKTGMGMGYKDADYAARGRANIQACLDARTLPFKKFVWDLYVDSCKYVNGLYVSMLPKGSMGSHSDGVVDLKGDPLEV